VQSAREIYQFVADEGAIEIDDPPIVIECAGGARVRAWVPTEARHYVCAIELDEPRAVKTTPSGVVARVWLPVDDEDL
jgi:hypothetical protein